MSDPYQCRYCRAGIALDDVNVSTDIALCRACGKTMPFSEIAPIPGAPEVDMANPPKGIRIDESAIHGKSIVYRKISPILFFLIPFTAVWSGFSMFGIYGSQIASGEFQWGLSLFGLPFLIGTVFLLSLIVFNLFGSWRVQVHRGVLEVTMQVGVAGWTRRLVCDSDARVRLARYDGQDNSNQRVVEVESRGKSLKFGSAISEPGKAYIAGSLRRIFGEN